MRQDRNRFRSRDNGEINAVSLIKRPNYSPLWEFECDEPLPERKEPDRQKHPDVGSHCGEGRSG